jgi:hypothetical protein
MLILTTPVVAGDSGALLCGFVFRSLSPRYAILFFILAIELEASS